MNARVIPMAVEDDEIARRVQKQRFGAVQGAVPDVPHPSRPLHGADRMNAAKHIEYMDRAMNAGAMPAPYMVRREVDRIESILVQQTGRLYTSEQMAQQYKAGVTEGWRQARGWQARNTAVLIAFGVCVGVTLAVVFGPMVAFMLGAGA